MIEATVLEAETCIEDIDALIGEYHMGENFPAHKNNELIAYGPSLLAEAQGILVAFVKEYDANKA